MFSLEKATPASVVLSLPDVKMPQPDATTTRSGM
jgi:hypothetical protein